MNENLKLFAQAVGTDIKELKALIATNKIDVDKLKQVDVTALISTAKQEVKNEILGGAGAEVDTLKEIADLIKNAEGSTSEAFLQKLTEQNQKIQALENALKQDFVQLYTTAKGV